MHRLFFKLLPFRKKGCLFLSYRTLDTQLCLMGIILETFSQSKELNRFYDFDKECDGENTAVHVRCVQTSIAII